MRSYLLVAGVLLLGACGEKTAPTKALTQHEKDSVIAGSRLPGAKGVGAAMRLADSGVARNARLDSVNQDH